MRVRCAWLQIPSMQFSTDHQAVVWCNQLVRKVTDATVALADRCDNHTGTTVKGRGRASKRAASKTGAPPSPAYSRPLASSVACNASRRATLFRRALLRGRPTAPVPHKYLLDGFVEAEAVLALQLLRLAPMVAVIGTAVVLMVLARLVTPVALRGAVGAFYRPPSSDVRAN